MNYWFPQLYPNKGRFPSKEIDEVKTHIEKGGSLIEVPIFQSKEETEDWIKKQNNPQSYTPLFFSNLRDFDENGNQVDLLIRKPGEAILTVKEIEVPKNVYFLV